MWIDDDDRAVERLEHLYRLPSPARLTLRDIQTNAVLIDRSGHIRPVNLPAILPIVRVPRPVPVRVVFESDPEAIFFGVNQIAEFRLSSIQDGIAIYQLA